ncbi:ABC transporter permease [Paenibacillus sp. NFR01]|uniref:ABC transporter permease n=1 Tax=Paenibacillus sp. NFR01 TaxID=1566279 RepID=UPI0008AEBB57|nr:ABC transporter permease [Paenibacillus sp. NFR01]SEU20827.1 putative ABC transport system permease protein [Paenibacillus sp. NFR01]
MMFPNNNKAVIRRLIRRGLKTNRARNRFVLLAIGLTTWLLTSFFSIGLSYSKSVGQFDIKLAGTAADVSLNAPTAAQLDKVQSLPYIRAAGLAAYVGTAVNPPDLNDLKLALRWYDSGEWTDMRRPAIDGLKGHYPQARNEIAVPLWVLKRMGIEHPKLGMALPLSYTIGRSSGAAVQRQTFVLSGYFKEYTFIQNGRSADLLVSSAFAESGGTGEPHPDMASIIGAGKEDPERLAKRLETDLGPDSAGQIGVSRMMTSSGTDRIATLAGYGGLIFFVMLSGYLLIYNILYISVSRDTRYYGLLKTLGTTRRQILSIVRGQALRLSLIAIPLGLLAGAATSFGVVPLALRTTNIETGIDMSFNPLIFAGAALFAWLTTWISCIKPARLAAKVSPVEAVRHTGVEQKAKRKRSSAGAKLHRMALSNIFRIKKRAFVVLLSLFMGLATFLVVTTIVLSMDTDNLVDQYMKHDFTLTNQTLELGYQGDADKPVLTDEMADTIRAMEGVTSVHAVYSLFGRMDYDPKVFGAYVDGFAANYHTERPSDAVLAGKENGMFGPARVAGLDLPAAKALIREAGLTVDLDRFAKGELALLDNMRIDGLTAGDKFRLGVYGSDQRVTYEIGGTGDFTSIETSHMMAPNVYLSEAGIRRLQSDPLIGKLYVDAKPGDWKAVSDGLQKLAGPGGEVKLESKLEQRAELDSIKSTLYILGGGVGLILAFIGILNFVNLMYTGVLARKLEFAVLESIGMTRRQMKKLLLYEGAGYAVISAVLISTLGTLLSYGIFRLFVQEADYAVFRFPYLPLAISFVLVFAVCLSVPLLAYRQISGASLVERLREIE